jgi:hypothetical protein
MGQNHKMMPCISHLHMCMPYLVFGQMPHYWRSSWCEEMWRNNEGAIGLGGKKDLLIYC